MNNKNCIGCKHLVMDTLYCRWYKNDLQYNADHIPMRLYKCTKCTKEDKVKNYNLQYYKGLPIRLINRYYSDKKAKRFTIMDTTQNVWIPNVYLNEDGTIKNNANLDFVFCTKTALHKIDLARKESAFKRKSAEEREKRREERLRNK